MEQLTCAECNTPLEMADLFCGVCGTRAPWPGDGNRTFFDHEPQRPGGPLSNATRFLCAAAYLDRGFANQVIGHLVATRRAVAPSLNFDVGPVIRHCLRARRNILIRDLVLLAAVLLGLIVEPATTAYFLLIAIMLGLVGPAARWSRKSFARRVIFAVGLLFAFWVIFSVTIALFFGVLFSTFTTGNFVLVAAARVLKLGLTVVLLIGITLGTQFAFIRSTFRTLIDHLRLGAPPPARRTSGATEARIATVEGAQWGNVTLYGGEDPFIGAGSILDRHWSIAIKLEPAAAARRLFSPHLGADGQPKIDTVELHEEIRKRLLRLSDANLPAGQRIAGLTVSDRLVGSGLLRWTSPLVDRERRTPYSRASRNAVEALIRNPQAGLRYYQHIAVSDEGPPVTTASGETVLDGVDQGLAVSAFVYAAVEGRMFYLQFVLTALSPIASGYQIIDLWPSTSSPKFWRMTLGLTLKTAFSALLSAPLALWQALRLAMRERHLEDESQVFDGSVAGNLGALVSARELATSDSLGSHIAELDVEKYQKIIQRMLLETVQDFLATHGVDTSAFVGSASVINGDVNVVGTITGGTNQVGGQDNTIRHETASATGH
jgi:hypothetical protein